MKKIELKNGDWVVVCDGRKMLVLENQGDEMFPNLRTHEAREQENDKTSELGTDKPGRVHQAAGTAASAVEQTDWHDQAEHVFLKEVAHRLDEAVRKGETKSIVLIAAPRALGMIRPEYTHAVKEAISAEIDKDMVNLPVYDIEQRLTQSAA